MTARPQRVASILTNALNPFFIFTALYALVAFLDAGLSRGLLYLAMELISAVAVAGYVLLMRRRSRVGDFWISARAERLTPALFLLTAFVALLTVLFLLDAPQDLFLITLSMGLASAAVALITLFWKSSAHCTVAGHAAAAGLLLLGPLGPVFLLVLPLVIWSRIVMGAHTLLQTLVGTAVGAGLATIFLV
jgi:membrane-associated phospholipid phosphatase